jgi:uncharacterized protein YfaA (DUF2138 family)
MHMTQKVGEAACCWLGANAYYSVNRVLDVCGAARENRGLGLLFGDVLGATGRKSPKGNVAVAQSQHQNALIRTKPAYTDTTLRADESQPGTILSGPDWTRLD